MVDAAKIVQEVMYAKQRAYEYRDRAGKQLAQILSEHPVNSKPQPIITKKGDLTKNTTEKLQIFFEYYQELYLSESEGQGGGEHVFQ